MIAGIWNGTSSDASALGATAFAPNEPDRWPGWEDSSVPPERIGEYLRDLKALFGRYDYDGSVYGHFGQGLVHCRLPFDFGNDRGRMKFRAFLDDAADLVLSYGGSLSGEHGDGQARAALLPKMFGEELVEAFREFIIMIQSIGLSDEAMHRMIRDNPAELFRCRPVGGSPSGERHA